MGQHQRKQKVRAKVLAPVFTPTALPPDLQYFLTPAFQVSLKQQDECRKAMLALPDEQAITIPPIACTFSLESELDDEGLAHRIVQIIPTADSIIVKSARWDETCDFQIEAIITLPRSIKPKHALGNVRLRGCPVEDRDKYSSFFLREAVTLIAAVYFLVQQLNEEHP